MGDKFSQWQKVSTGVPQGSILGPLFFNIFINNLFLFVETTTLFKYADGNTMYSSDKNSNIAIRRLRLDFAIISECYYENYMILNPDKCSLLTFVLINLSQISPLKIPPKNVTEERILGIVINNNLNLKSHVKKMCEKSIQKLSALARISKLTPT